MKTEFLEKFNKDLKRIKSKSVHELVFEVILNVENAESLSNIKNLKKLSGFTNAYRIRFGNYRIGFYLEEDVVLFARVSQRKDIYKIFP